MAPLPQHDRDNYYPDQYDLKHWLPTTVKEARMHGWEEPDVILFSGDAYVDHPSFGAAVIGRTLQQLGLKVALVPQPNWKDDLRDFKKFGKPRLFFGITSGNMDSMVNHYTAAKRLRSTDAYTPGNMAGFRPDRATTVYAQILRKLFPDSLIIAGGIEASLRRFTHYDYWADKLMPSILDGGFIDLVAYGMAEKTIRKIALGLLSGRSISAIHQFPQIAFASDQPDGRLISDLPFPDIWLESHHNCLKDKVAYARNFAVIEKASNSLDPPRLLQESADRRVIIVNPPEPILPEEELDEIFDYPYTRLPHPKYWKKPLIPAFEMIRFSVNIHRGCFGGCAFCTISTHQGKFIQNRSEHSIIQEVEKITKMPGFAGNLSDLGGPSANMYRMKGFDEGICQSCKRPSCIYPEICKNLNTSHTPLLNLYRRVKRIPRVKKVFIGSGVRYDLITKNLHLSKGDYREYAEELIRDHVSGRLKVAPEHTHKHVLDLMRKPDFEHFKTFNKLFGRVNQKLNKNQQLIPYFISAHPGCSMEDMAELAADTKDLNFRLQQVQDFTPTPMTLATVMFYTGLNPYTLKPVQVATNPEDKKQMTRFFFWYKPEEQRQIQRQLHQMNRPDLITRLKK